MTAALGGGSAKAVEQQVQGLVIPLKREVSPVKILLWIVGIFALIGMLVVGGCFKLVF